MRAAPPCPEVDSISFSPAEAVAVPAQATWADALFETDGPDPVPACVSAPITEGAATPVQTANEGTGASETDPYYAASTLFVETAEMQALAPAYLSIFTLEELGLLYVLEHSPVMTRQAALRLARNRGVDADGADEVVDFYFMRKKSPASRPGEMVLPAMNEMPQAEVEAAAEEAPEKGMRKRAVRGEGKRSEVREPVIHVLGEAEQTVCMLALKGVDQVALRTDLVEELERSYPAIDVRAELMRMDQWLRANPEKRKTPRGARRFINTWLSNASDRERMRRDMLNAGTATRNGFGTGAGKVDVSGTPESGHATAVSATGDGLGDFLD